jgi:hypothetical protein
MRLASAAAILMDGHVCDLLLREGETYGNL